MLFETQFIEHQVFNSFITYLVGHTRPLSEVVPPSWKDISELHVNEFSGMTFDRGSLEELNAMSEITIVALRAHITLRDCDFLMSFKRGEPN